MDDDLLQDGEGSGSEIYNYSISYQENQTLVHVEGTYGQADRILCINWICQPRRDGPEGGTCTSRAETM